MSEIGPYGSEIGVGDLVRITGGTSAFVGKVGRIGRRAHPASPWTWVVYNLPEDPPMWGAAVNGNDIEMVDGDAA